MHHPNERAYEYTISRHLAPVHRHAVQAHTNMCCVYVHKQAELHTMCTLRRSGPQVMCTVTEIL